MHLNRHVKEEITGPRYINDSKAANHMHETKIVTKNINIIYIGYNIYTTIRGITISLIVVSLLSNIM